MTQGVAESKAIGLVVTPENVESKWVKGEYERTLLLANQRKLRVIPLLFRDVELPGFLTDLHSVDFRDNDAYERNVDRIIWPAITGRQVIFVGVHPGRRAPWPGFRRMLNDLGVRFVQGENINRARNHIGQITKAGSHRIVVVLDIFEDWPAYRWPRRNSPEQYVALIFDIRDRTKDTKDEVVFLLLNHSEAFARMDHSLDEHKLERVQRYCSPHWDLEEDLFEARLRKTWYRLQRDLLKAEIGGHSDEGG